MSENFKIILLKKFKFVKKKFSNDIAFVFSVYFIFICQLNFKLKTDTEKKDGCFRFVSLVYNYNFGDFLKNF